MHEFSDKSREVLERAFEVLEQANRTLSQPQRDPVADVSYAPRAAEWDPANPRGLTVKTMNRAEFNAWCDAGRPPLEPPKPAPQPQRTAEMDAGTQAAWDRWWDSRFSAAIERWGNGLVATLGKEVDMLISARLREEVEARLDEVRAAICRLERSTDAIVDLPDWRSHHVEH